MKWVLIVVAVLVGLVVLAALIGLMLPKGHVATRTVRLKAAPPAVWAVITNVADTPAWFKSIVKAERLPDCDGHEVWLETRSDGMKMPMETIEVVPNQRLVRLIADPKLPFGGTWTFELAPAPAPAGTGSTLTITERGEVRHPIFRLVSKFMDMRATIDLYLKALAQRLGEEAVLEEASGGA